MRWGTVSHIGRRWWTSPLLLVLMRTPPVLISSSSKISSAVVVVIGSIVVVVIVVHSHPTPVHMSPTVWGTTGTRRRWNEPGTNPAAITRLLVVVEGDTGALVEVFLPSVLEGWDHRIVLAPGADVTLLGRGQSHSSLLPFYDMFLVVQLKVLAKLPSTSLLFAAGGTVVCQIRVGVVVEKAGHGERISILRISRSILWRLPSNNFFSCSCLVFQVRLSLVNNNCPLDIVDCEGEIQYRYNERNSLWQQHRLIGRIGRLRPNTSAAARKK